MCIIAEEIESVSNTKLFCGLNQDKTRQLTVYSNDVNSVGTNAMILPVTNPESIEFHDLTEYEDFFEDCQNCFYNPTKSFNYSNDAMRCFDCDDSLKVFDVGSYQVSVANNLNDLKRVNTNVFTISNKLDQMLSKFYSASHFGFIICTLKKGNHNYHPLAYSHNVYKNKPFLPAIHYHVSGDDNSGFHSMADDWDHDIYLYNMKPSDKVKSMNSNNKVWNNKTTFKNRLEFKLGDCTEFHKIQIKDRHPNIDIICKI